MSFPKTGLTNKWSTETQVATSQSYENSANIVYPKISNIWSILPSPS